MCFFFKNTKKIWVSNSYQSKSSWMWQQCSSRVVCSHKSVWSIVEPPSGKHILSLCYVSFNVWGKAAHRVLQSHNEALLRQTKRDQTICAWWTLISLTVDIAVSCQLWESIYFILHGPFVWVSESFIYIEQGFFVGFIQAFVELADSQKEHVGLVCLC